MRISSDGQYFRCSVCGGVKPSSAFSFSDRAAGSLNWYCRACHAAYRRAHYLANKSEYIRRASTQVRGRRELNRREVLIYLATHPCVDCGVTDPVVLEFDHRSPDEKITEVSRLMVAKRWSRVLSEIEKCDVRCVNCHRRRTSRQFGWAKSREVPRPVRAPGIEKLLELVTVS